MRLRERSKERETRSEARSDKDMDSDMEWGRFRNAEMRETWRKRDSEKELRQSQKKESRDCLNWDPNASFRRAGLHFKGAH